MRIAVDVMGGDMGPAEMIPGALMARDQYGAQVIFVGDEETIKAHLKENGRDESDIEIVHAADSISMDEDPLAAVRHKRDSSMVVAAKLVREKKAQAAVTSGSTGALVAAGPLVVGRLKGASRPALATPIPTVGGHPCVILDIGANPECQAKNLLEFAIMGSAYASALLGIDNPSIGLLSNGTEASKGTSVIVQANQMLSGSGLNFVGNIEARSIFYGEADVVVMDGFAGNVVLKLSEGLGSAIFDMVKEEMSKGCMVKAGALLVKPALKSVKRRMDYSEYGGAPLLGLSGLLVKAHGSSNRKAFANAIRVTSELLDRGLVEKMSQSLSAMVDGEA
ncbi:MAG: phosphate acyltransferase PlsX [Bacillota bacterium]|jgi:glycerol-3-phosphate acyltransferase PlsX|nr:phosphate acyltransferase PlsX [Bacillota bacterium]HOB42446.1 phosphate acyltransferase PlsX [Bacillota bacterium]HOO29573.1 phosphate acyltransferase PlsX [Bacillota bacterium]HPZ13425.1 phosphate acyltransferase PlsX [Bacillota bacterium]HQD79694.1 phosphate acyltransferase PlsX [Bacillota bacterium]